MTVWHVIAVLTPALSALAVVYALRLFPIARHTSDQFEMDLKKPRSSMAHDIDQMTMTVKEEVKRLRSLPKKPR